MPLELTMLLCKYWVTLGFFLALLSFSLGPFWAGGLMYSHALNKVLASEAAVHGTCSVSGYKVKPPGHWDLQSSYKPFAQLLSTSVPPGLHPALVVPGDLSSLCFSDQAVEEQPSETFVLLLPTALTCLPPTYVLLWSHAELKASLIGFQSSLL